MNTLERTIYDALLEAGVKNETASRAAERASEYVTRDDLKDITDALHGVEKSIVSLEIQSKMMQWIVTAVGMVTIVSIFLNQMN